MCARARAARARPVDHVPSNETLEEVTQNPKMDEKWKKIGHRGKQGQKRKGEKGRAGRPDAVRTSGEKSIFEITPKTR